MITLVNSTSKSLLMSLAKPVSVKIDGKDIDTNTLEIKGGKSCEGLPDSVADELMTKDYIESGKLKITYAEIDEEELEQPAKVHKHKSKQKDTEAKSDSTDANSDDEKSDTKEDSKDEKLNMV